MLVKDRLGNTSPSKLILKVSLKNLYDQNYAFAEQDWADESTA